MAFAKLDTQILDSTLWLDRDGRDLFITALLLAEPWEFLEPMEQLETKSLNKTGFVVPPGWYGFIRSAGIGIVKRAGLDPEPGYKALDMLASEDPESRSNEHGGRRLVRVGGGYIVLNFMKYRDYDHTAADRQRRLRARKKGETVTRDTVTVTRDVTHSRRQRQKADAESIASQLASVASPTASLALPESLGKPASSQTASSQPAKLSPVSTETVSQRASEPPPNPANPPQDYQDFVNSLAAMVDRLTGYRDQDVDLESKEITRLEPLKTEPNLEGILSWALSDKYWSAQMLDNGNSAMKVFIRAFETIKAQFKSPKKNAVTPKTEVKKRALPPLAPFESSLDIQKKRQAAEAADRLEWESRL